jgi:hypothetical protein
VWPFVATAVQPALLLLIVPTATYAWCTHAYRSYWPADALATEVVGDGAYRSAPVATSTKNPGAPRVVRVMAWLSFVQTEPLEDEESDGEERRPMRLP